MLFRLEFIVVAVWYTFIIFLTVVLRCDTGITKKMLYILKRERNMNFRIL